MIGTIAGSIAHDGMEHFNRMFDMQIDSELERWRFDTFWEKEPETLEWIRDFKPGEVFFDIGANIGLYSLYCAAIHPEVKVYAFEPVAQNYCRLVENIALNGFGDRIMALPLAWGEYSGIGKITVPDTRIGCSGGQIGEVGQDVIITSWYLAWLFGFRIPSHIKIDVDGVEYGILKGMRPLCLEHGGYDFLIEVNKDASGNSPIPAFMAEHGFTTDNRYNRLENHSNKRRGGNPENVVFTRRAG